MTRSAVGRLRHGYRIARFASRRFASGLQPPSRLQSQQRHWFIETLQRNCFAFRRVRLEQRLDRRVLGDLAGEDDVAAAALRLQAGGHVDGGAEVVEALVQGHRNRRALVQADLDDQRVFPGLGPGLGYATSYGNGPAPPA